ncbi:single-stranded DNA-binding protein [uncultured Bacteroides sp.]|uniref:single-stranded DNA-binding protein n=1 Tax=uncultured Bacteroides sp. TaxID=162156 RepID=UPI0026394FE3|nr:single-stranded DNA-binding protein [uncultured Bacteroides sp.]
MRESYKLLIYGTICNDLAIAETATGKKYLKVNISVSNTLKKKDGTDFLHCEYFNCTCWENVAEEIYANYKKGNKISVECKRSLAEYVNKQGVTIKDWNINIQKVVIVDEDRSDDSAKAPKAVNKTQAKKEPTPPLDADDEMPF